MSIGDNGHVSEITSDEADDEVYARANITEKGLYKKWRLTLSNGTRYFRVVWQGSDVPSPQNPIVVGGHRVVGFDRKTCKFADYIECGLWWPNLWRRDSLVISTYEDDHSEAVICINERANGRLRIIALEKLADHYTAGVPIEIKFGEQVRLRRIRGQPLPVSLYVEVRQIANLWALIPARELGPISGKELPCNVAIFRWVRIDQARELQGGGITTDIAYLDTLLKSAAGAGYCIVAALPVEGVSDLMGARLLKVECETLFLELNAVMGF